MSNRDVLMGKADNSGPPQPPAGPSSAMSEPEGDPDNHVSFDEMRAAMKEFVEERPRLINLEQRGLNVDDA